MYAWMALSALIVANSVRSDFGAKEVPNYYVIRYNNSNLVLDASEERVKIQKFTGTDAQKWWYSTEGPGVSYVYNKKTNLVLDIRESMYAGDIITYKKRTLDNLNQVWFINFDQTIVSSMKELAITVFNKSTEAGARVFAWPKDNSDSQKFMFEPVNQQKL